MPTAIFVHDGNAIDYTPASDVAAGDVVVQGELIGLAKQPIQAGTRGALAVTGVFEVPKATGPGTAISAGAQVFWHATSRVATTTSSNGTHRRLGNAIAAAFFSDATVRVRLMTGIPDVGAAPLPQPLSPELANDPKDANAVRIQSRKQ